jgi:dipeptidyl aminopeptidase/acylaminoacyl peptidase
MGVEGMFLMISKWRPLLQEKHNETAPRISPDGQWLAYASDESGRLEVYVRPFPDVDSGGKWQVSTSGGDSPLWSPTGHELFYRNGDAVMVVPVETDQLFIPGKPKILFQGTYYSSASGNPQMWDISPDGKRFLMMKPAVAADEKSTEESPAGIPRQINIVLNWQEELKQRVPVK